MFVGGRVWSADLCRRNGGALVVVGEKAQREKCSVNVKQGSDAGCDGCWRKVNFGRHLIMEGIHNYLHI